MYILKKRVFFFGQGGENSVKLRYEILTYISEKVIPLQRNLEFQEALTQFLQI